MTKDVKEVAFLANTLTEVLTARIKLSKEQREVLTTFRDALNKFIEKKVKEIEK